MTENQKHKHDIMKIVEKSWYQSKKFLGFLLTMACLFAMATNAALLHQRQYIVLKGWGCGCQRTGEGGSKRSA